MIRMNSFRTFFKREASAPNFPNRSSHGTSNHVAVVTPEALPLQPSPEILEIITPNIPETFPEKVLPESTISDVVSDVAFPEFAVPSSEVVLTENPENVLPEIIIPNRELPVKVNSEIVLSDIYTGGEDGKEMSDNEKNQLTRRIKELELELKECKAAEHSSTTREHSLMASLKDSEELAKSYKQGKEELFAAVVKLNNRIELQNKSATESLKMRSKLPSMIKELKEQDEEVTRLRQERFHIDIEKSKLARYCETLNMRDNERLDEIASLKAEILDRDSEQSIDLQLKNKIPFSLPVEDAMILQSKKIEELKAELAEIKSSALRLTDSLIESQDLADVYKKGKEELFSAVMNLNNRIEMQNKTSAESQRMLLNLPAAVSALRFLNDETSKLGEGPVDGVKTGEGGVGSEGGDKINDNIEKESLSQMIVSLKQRDSVRLTELSIMRQEIEVKLKDTIEERENSEKSRNTENSEKSKNSMITVNNEKRENVPLIKKCDSNVSSGSNLTLDNDDDIVPYSPRGVISFSEKSVDTVDMYIPAYKVTVMPPLKEDVMETVKEDKVDVKEEVEITVEIVEMASADIPVIVVVEVPVTVVDVPLIVPVIVVVEGSHVVDVECVSSPLTVATEASSTTEIIDSIIPSIIDTTIVETSVVETTIKESTIDTSIEINSPISIGTPTNTPIVATHHVHTHPNHTHPTPIHHTPHHTPVVHSIPFNSLFAFIPSAESPDVAESSDQSPYESEGVSVSIGGSNVNIVASNLITTAVETAVASIVATVVASMVTSVVNTAISNHVTSTIAAMTAIEKTTEAVRVENTKNVEISEVIISAENSADNSERSEESVPDEVAGESVVTDNVAPKNLLSQFMTDTPVVSTAESAVDCAVCAEAKDLSGTIVDTANLSGTILGSDLSGTFDKAFLSGTIPTGHNMYKDFINSNLNGSAVKKKVKFDIQSETDDDHIVKIERLQTDLDNYRSSMISMTNSLQQSEDIIKFHVDTKEELALTVVSLNEKIELQNTEARDVWMKLPPIVAALQRLDDETVRLRHERHLSEKNTKKLNHTIELLKEENETIINNKSTSENDSESHKVTKLTLEKVESELGSIQKAYTSLVNRLEEEEVKSEALKKSKEDLFAAVIELNNRIEMQNKATADAEIILLKLPAAVRALRRLDDENVQFRLNTESQKEELIRTIESLNGTVKENEEKHFKEVGILRIELENKKKCVLDCELSLEKVTASTAAAMVSLVASFKESKFNNNNNINSIPASMKLITRGNASPGRPRNSRRRSWL